MTNSQYFITFGDRTIDDVMEATSLLGEEAFSSCGIRMIATATFEKGLSLVNIKRGETYLIVQGDSDRISNKDFLDDHDDFCYCDESCRVLAAETVRSEFPESKYLIDYATIYTFEWRREEVKNHEIIEELKERYLRLNMEFVDKELEGILSSVLSRQGMTLDEIDVLDAVAFDEDIIKRYVKYAVELTCLDKEGLRHELTFDLQKIHTVYDFDSENLYGIFNVITEC